jgi:integrase
MTVKDLTFRQAKSREKAYKIAAEHGLYMLVLPKGSKLWRFKYRFEGKEKLLALGSYPEVTTARAVEKRGEARRQLDEGIDPSAARQAAKASQSGADSFETVAREWHAKQAPNWSKSHADKILRRLETFIFPWLGGEPVGHIPAPKLLHVLNKIEDGGVRRETAHRCLQNCGQVFRYAIVTGRAERNPATDLKGALAPWQPKHYPTITEPKAVGQLLRALEGYTGGLVVKSALRLAPLVFVRPGELRAAAWSEINLDASEWRIPAERMKMGEQHIVPLSKQAVEILRGLEPLTGRDRLVFPGMRRREKPMSENTLNMALRALGYGKDQFTGHAFRSIASTLLHELGWNHQVIELQLAHAERNEVSAAYNYAQHLPERRKMMQAWADYLEALRENRKVIAGKFGRAA